MEKLNKLVLAEGETHSHLHLIEGDIELYDDNKQKGFKYFKAKGTLTHPEHALMKFENKRVVYAHQKEIDPITKKLRNIWD